MLTGKRQIGITARLQLLGNLPQFAGDPVSPLSRRHHSPLPPEGSSSMTQPFSDDRVPTLVSCCQRGACADSSLPFAHAQNSPVAAVHVDG
jgi:hypothetical protein